MTRECYSLVYSPFKLLLHHTADFDAVGQSAAESVQTGGETADVDGGLVLECCHAAAGVVEDVDTFNLAVGFDGDHAGSRVGEDGHPFLRERLIVGGIVPVAVKSFRCREAERDIVDVVAAVFARLTGGEDIAESDIVTAAGVGGEVDSAEDGSRGGRVVESGDRDESTGVGEVGHDTHLELVLGLSLAEVESELQVTDVAEVLWHGEDAALVEDDGVAAAVCLSGRVVNHGLVLVGHGYIRVCESPARNRHASLGSGGGSVGVEVVGVGEIVGIDGAASFETDVVDIVAAEVAGLSRGEDIAESDIATGAGVRGEVYSLQDGGGGGGIVDSGDRHEGTGVGEVGHDTHLELVLGLCLPDVEGELQRADIAVELGHGEYAALVEDDGVAAAV